MHFQILHSSMYMLQESRMTRLDDEFQQDFEYNREKHFNRLLPYANELDNEAKYLLAEIKANLGRSIMLRKIYPDSAAWWCRLTTYVKSYYYIL